jgi:molybdopterin molybdotransferase
MTGAPMPEGSDAVVVMEVVQALADDTVAVPGPVPVGANRRLRGEHVRAGDTVLSPGRRLRMAQLALASAIGTVEVAVYRRLRVGVLSTGDELRDPPADLRQNGAYDSNRPMLLAAVEGAIMAGFDLGICPDDSAALARFIEMAFDQRLDSLLISGGAALGDADVVRTLAGVEFVPVNARPGRGIAVARLVRMGQGLLVLGLPGNAVAAYVVLHALALPLLARMAGSDARPPAPISMPIARDLRVRAGRIDFLRARLTRDSAGRQVADPLAEQGSAMIRSVCDADALIAVGPAAEYRAGELLPVYLLETFEIQR